MSEKLRIIGRGVDDLVRSTDAAWMQLATAAIPQC
jgi:hypothetical protein